MRDISQRQESSAITPAEEALLAAFRSASIEAQPTMVRMIQSIAKGSPRERPALTLVSKGGGNGKS